MTGVSARYLLKRLLYSYLVVVAIITLIFGFVKMRADSMADMISPQAPHYETLQEEWATSEPLWREFLVFQKNFHTGNFGYSTEFNEPVITVIVGRATPTLVLFGGALIAVFIIGPVAGTYLGWYRGSRFDKSTFTTGIVAYSVPAFWLGFLLLWVFWWHFDVLPRNYMFSQFPEFGEWTAVNTSINVLQHSAMPLLTLTFTGWAGAMIVMRSMVVAETQETYLHLARAKGLSERRLMFVHAARNALVPLVTQVVAVVSLLVGGAVVIERVFAWRGLGDLMVAGVEAGDMPVVLGSFFVLGLFIVVIRLFLDIAYTRLDPRIGFGESSLKRPAIRYPGGTNALWGAAGFLAILAVAVNTAAGRAEELLEATSADPYTGDALQGPGWEWIEHRDTDLPLTEIGVDTANVSTLDMGGVVFFNAHQISYTVPIEAFGEVGESSLTDLHSVSVNVLWNVGEPMLYPLFLLPPLVYMLTGITTTWNETELKPVDRGFRAASQFTGCLPLVVISMYLFSFSTSAGPATANPLFAILLAGVIYPAVFGFIGGYLAGWKR